MHIETIKRRRHSISLTPLIDVVFILLVFFMLATSFTDWRPIALATGTTATPDAHSKPPAVVHVASNGALSYEGDQYTVAALASRLIAARQDKRISAVIVAPDNDTTLNTTVGVLDALAGAGVKPMSLADGQSQSQSQSQP